MDKAKRTAKDIALEQEVKETFRLSEMMAKDLAGTLDPEETARLRAWLEQSEANREFYRAVLAGRLDPEGRWDLYAGMTGTELERFRRMNSGKRHFLLDRFRRMAAAAVLLLCAGGGLCWLLLEEPAPAPIARYAMNDPVLFLSSGQKVALDDTLQTVLHMERNADIHISDRTLSYCAGGSREEVSDVQESNRLVVPRGGEYCLQLADGSRVWLNSRSELRYPVRFSGETREVFLQGEGYFEVAPDRKHPFIVRTPGQVAVKVLGTEFNVSAYAGEKEVTTTLSTGKVVISTPAGLVLLSPDEQLVYRGKDGRNEIRNVNASIYGLWRKGLMGFSNERLENILYRLSLWYDVSFVFEDEALKNRHFTGILKRWESIDTILQALQKTLSVGFRLEGKEITVTE